MYHTTELSPVRHYLSMLNDGNREGRRLGERKRGDKERGVIVVGGVVLSRGKFLCTITQIRKSLTLY